MRFRAKTIINHNDGRKLAHHWNCEHKISNFMIAQCSVFMQLQEGSMDSHQDCKTKCRKMVISVVPVKHFLLSCC
jgi:hypothetical protein